MTMDNEDRYLGFLISDAARLMRTVFDRRVLRLGLTRAQWLVLTRLHRRPGASQSELAEMMEIEKASAGRLVDRLERKKWVERRPDPADRRVNRLYLTPEAEGIRKRMWTVAEQTVDDAMGELSAPEVEQLTDLLAKVKASLAGMAAGDETDRTTAPRRRSGRANGASHMPARAEIAHKSDYDETAAAQTAIAEGMTP